ncbi:hypothetical protein AC579_7086 [Pseudocercospora musae]|uniref:Acyltransferase 3 domain-containing protein n=1 Tax=Pseudocercospora musae TaxID=113226 RepID=A0A139GTF8_9PEZI|nr:hypothetical protein AC579_7086 [Pseudocercospora musae]
MTADEGPATGLGHFAIWHPLWSAHRMLDVFKPMILRKNSHPTTITRTSWMDGLRGTCAVIVVNFHFFFTFSPLPTLGYRTPTHLAASDHIAALPPFCLFWDGASCVNVFFAIAGYVCSFKALQLMQSGTSYQGQLLQSLSSSVFRRGFRLYLPTLAMTLITALLAHMNGFSLTNIMFANRKIWFRGVSSEVNVPHYDTLWGQIAFWASEVWHLMNVWESKPVYPVHDPHLWTIAYEYRMSLHLYIALVALANCRPHVRMVLLCALAILYPAWHRWEGLLFFAGAACAQWDVTQLSNRQEGYAAVTQGQSEELLPTKEGVLGTSPRVRPLRMTRTSLHRVVAYAFAVYLMSYPVSEFKNPSPGYAWMNVFIPSGYAHRENKFPKSVGVLILLYLLRDGAKGGKPGLWRSWLESDTALYLGRISFALYLVHATILHAVGYAIPHWIWASIGGSKAMSQWMIGIAVGWAASMILCLYFADIFHAEIELRCVRFVRWLEGRFKGTG